MMHDLQEEINASSQDKKDIVYSMLGRIDKLTRAYKAVKSKSPLDLDNKEYWQLHRNIELLSDAHALYVRYIHA